MADGAKGFAADDAKDLRPFGLSPPAATVEVTTAAGQGSAAGASISASPCPARATASMSARAIRMTWSSSSAQPLAELPQSAVALRSQKVADFEPIAVSEIRIKTPGAEFSCSRKSRTSGCRRSRSEEKADALTIVTLLKALDSLQTSEFLEPGKIRDPQLSPPLMTIQIRETRVGRSAATSATDELVLDLRIGRLDAARKVFFAQLANDQVF